MTRLARIFLSALLLPILSCGFNETQKTAFVRRVTEVLLDATDTSSSAVLARSAMASRPATIDTPAARSLVCQKHESRSKCTKSPARALRAAAAPRPLFEPVYIPLEVQVARLRLSAQRDSSARVRCEIASMREERRRDGDEKRFVMRTHFATPPDAIVPAPSFDFVIDNEAFVYETIGG